MTEEATVLYDFEGVAENGEMSLTEGEIIRVINKNIGDGWWEGATNDGRVGLFPETYVQAISNGTPRYSNVPGENYEEQISDNQFNLMETSPAHNSYQAEHFPPQQNNYRDDDAWSEDWDDSSTVATTVVPMHAGASKQYGSEAQDVSSINSVEGRSPKVTGTVGKNFNRFSSFVKHGGENYMLGKADARVRQVDQVHIEMNTEGPSWKKNEYSFTCEIGHPKQQSKMKGLKKFVCYNLTPSDTAVTVQRRYKHFDWLYDRLVDRYPMIAVPRLPDKQASGRFEEDFIEARMVRLKLWVDYICRHPVLSRSQLFRNFVTLTEQKAWKMSKRQAEKDDLSAANFFLTVSLPPTVNMVNDADGHLDQFKKFTKTMDDSVSQLSICAQSLSNKHTGMIKREYQTFGKALINLSAGFNMHQTSENKTLTNAIKGAGLTYNRVGELFAAQPKEDLHPLIASMWLYKGLLDTMPDIWHVQTGAMRKVRECRKLKEEGKITDAEIGAVTERADRVVGCMRAEMSHFHDERVHDFALLSRDFLRKQAEFYENVASEFRRALDAFSECNIES